jgi:transcriptional regulator with XRE-family HTH domain
MSTLADRVWQLIWSLPRNKRGKPPSYRSLEQEAGLSGGTLSRLTLGERDRPEPETLAALVEVCNKRLPKGVAPATLDWLISNKGEGPMPIPPLPVPPRLPYLVEESETTGDTAPPASSMRPIDEAVQLVYAAARANPDASVLEILLQAQIAAVRQQK